METPHSSSSYGQLHRATRPQEQGWCCPLGEFREVHNTSSCPVSGFGLEFTLLAFLDFQLADENFWGLGFMVTQSHSCFFIGTDMYAFPTWLYFSRELRIAQHSWMTSAVLTLGLSSLLFYQCCMKEKQVVNFPLSPPLSLSLLSFSFVPLCLFVFPPPPSDLCRRKVGREWFWFCAPCPFTNGQRTRNHSSCLHSILHTPGEQLILRGSPREHMGAPIWTSGGPRTGNRW